MRWTKMRYYMIRHDKRINNGPDLLDWYKKVNVVDLHWGSFHKVPEINIMYIKENAEVYFSDVITFPFFLLSEKIERILKKYEPNMGYRQFILIEKKHEYMQQYFLPHLMRVDCVSEKSQFNQDRSQIIKCCLVQSKLPDKCIFELEHVKDRHVIVRQDFLESILRRNAMICFEECEMEEK